MRLPSRFVSLRCTLPLACAFALGATSANAAVFINELHYDDAGASGDSGEGVEVVATAGESLSGYRIYLYNGAAPGAAVMYANTAVPAGTVVSCGSQVRIATVSYASNGVQNGPNDGVALVDPNRQLVQFLSYEGAITGSGGPAARRPA